MEFPCWRYWADGAQALVETPAQLAALPPGHAANPGMFLPPGHPAYVAPAPPPALEAPTGGDSLHWDQPVLPVPPPPRKRGRPRKDEVRA